MQPQMPDPHLELRVTEITDVVVGNHCSNFPVHGESAQRLEHRGEKVNGEVMAPRHGVQEHVSCMLAHDLLNRVTAIVGFCDLIASDPTDSQKEIHLHRLRVTALLIADMLHERSCSLVTCPPDQQECVENPVEKKTPEKVELKLYERRDTPYLAIHPL